MEIMAQSESEDRFGQLYMAPRPGFDLDPVSLQLVTIVDDAVLGNHTPQAAARAVANLVMAQSDLETPFHTVLRVCQAAALRFEDEDALKQVVDFLIALASLPDAINESSETKTAHTYHPLIKSGVLTYDPGDAIMFDEGEVLWRDLPGWSLMITEAHQGPEKYLLKHRGKDDPPTAALKWKRFNTYLALFSADPTSRGIPKLKQLSMLGLQTCAISLEYSCDAWNRTVELWVPAAAAWMRIASDELARICASERKTHPPGDLWEAEGGNESCDTRRFEFWKRRLGDNGF